MIIKSTDQNRLILDLKICYTRSDIISVTQDERFLTTHCKGNFVEKSYSSQRFAGGETTGC